MNICLKNNVATLFRILSASIIALCVLSGCEFSYKSQQDSTNNAESSSNSSEITQSEVQADTADIMVTEKSSNKSKEEMLKKTVVVVNEMWDNFIDEYTKEQKPLLDELTLISHGLETTDSGDLYYSVNMRYDDISRISYVDEKGYENFKKNHLLTLSKESKRAFEAIDYSNININIKIIADINAMKYYPYNIDDNEKTVTYIMIANNDVIFDYAENTEGEEVAPIQNEKPKETTKSSKYQEPFYAILCMASKDPADAEKSVEYLNENGFNAHMLLTTDWSNLNSEPWYVVTAGYYNTEDAAQNDLSSVRKLYSDAYIKYTGDWQG